MDGWIIFYMKMKYYKDNITNQNSSCKQRIELITVNQVIILHNFGI